MVACQGGLLRPVWDSLAILYYQNCKNKILLLLGAKHVTC